MKKLFSLLFLCALAVPIVAQSTQDLTANPQEQNKALVRRFYAEVWEKGNLAVADEIFAANYVRHDPRGGPPAGAPESAQSQRGESPLQADALRPVTDCNCIRPRGGVGSSRR